MRPVVSSPSAVNEDTCERCGAKDVDLFSVAGLSVRAPALGVRRPLELCEACARHLGRPRAVVPSK